MHKPWFGLFVKLGAVIGLSSVLLVLSYGQSRVFFAMSRDGLMPAFFARLHPRYCTPWAGTIALAAGMGIAAAFLPLTLPERESGGSGTGVSVRVDSGGRR